MTVEHNPKNLHLASHDPLENILSKHIDAFVSGNQAAQVVAKGLSILGVGLRPLIDHMTFRTLDIEARAREFTAQGYEWDESAGIIEYESWKAKVYRKPGYPAIFIDQAYEDARGEGSPISAWVHKFGDQGLHHLAIQVDEITQAIYYLEKQGVRFSGKIIGAKHTNLRQVFTLPEDVDGVQYTVLELSERHCGYTGFSSPQTEGLAGSAEAEAPKKQQK